MLFLEVHGMQLWLSFILQFTIVTKRRRAACTIFPKNPQGLPQQLCRLTGKHLKKVLKPFARRRVFKRLKNQRLQQLSRESRRCEGEKNAERIITQSRQDLSGLHCCEPDPAQTGKITKTSFVVAKKTPS